MSPGLCGGQWRMPGCPLWSPVCLSSGWASTGWCGARSAPPRGSASRWSSLLSSASGSAWGASVRIPASRATTPRWSRRTGRRPTRSSDRASGSVSDGARLKQCSLFMRDINRPLRLTNGAALTSGFIVFPLQRWRSAVWLLLNSLYGGKWCGKRHKIAI